MTAIPGSAKGITLTRSMSEGGKDTTRGMRSYGLLEINIATTNDGEIENATSPATRALPKADRGIHGTPGITSGYRKASIPEETVTSPHRGRKIQDIDIGDGGRRALTLGPHLRRIEDSTDSTDTAPTRMKASTEKESAVITSSIKKTVQGPRGIGDRGLQVLAPGLHWLQNVDTIRLPSDGENLTRGTLTRDVIEPVLRQPGSEKI